MIDDRFGKFDRIEYNCIIIQFQIKDHTLRDILWSPRKRSESVFVGLFKPGCTIDSIKRELACARIKRSRAIMRIGTWYPTTAIFVLTCVPIYKAPLFYFNHIPTGDIYGIWIWIIFDLSVICSPSSQLQFTSCVTSRVICPELDSPIYL